MSARVSRSLLALLVVASLVGPLAGGGHQTDVLVGDASAQTETPATVPVGSTTITIQLESDGDARWTIRTWLGVQDEQERQAFRDLAERYDRGAIDPPWMESVRAARKAAQRSTGRPMQISGVQKSSNVTNGTLAVRFTWTNFARDDEETDRYVVDDVFNTTHGTWIDGLTADQTLVIELPSGYGVLSAPKGAVVQNGRVRWDGPAQFEPGYMRVVYSGDAGPNALFPASWPFGTDGVFLGGVLIVGAVLGAYVLRHRRDAPESGGGDSGHAEAATDRPAATHTRDQRGPNTAPGSSEASEPEPDDDPNEGPDDALDTELLSDEERVEHLLETNGGRMKQANIVKETGWSNAKVSQLLSAMAEDGQIDKLRIGRENLISFPDEDVTDIDRDS